MSMAKEMCGTCSTYGYTNTRFQSLNATGKLRNSSNPRRRRSSNNVEEKEFEFKMPVVLSPNAKSFKGYQHLKIISVPGFILIKRNKAKEFLSKAATSSVFTCLPYFALYIITVVLTGIIMWILVSDSINFNGSLKKSRLKDIGNHFIIKLMQKLDVSKTSVFLLSKTYIS